jgi:hypothetical protein
MGKDLLSQQLLRLSDFETEVPLLGTNDLMPNGPRATPVVAMTSSALFQIGLELLDALLRVG